MKIIPALFGLLIGSLALVPLASNAQEGVSVGKIVIGQSAALSGPAQALGNEMRAGALAYFKEVNAKGGVNGRQIELKSYDDGYEPDRTVANTKKLLQEDQVLALFGYVGTPTSNAILPEIEKEKVPFIGAFTGADSLRNPFNRYIFNIRASYYDETEKIVGHLTSLHINKIAVFYQNDAFGKAGLTGVQRALEKRGMKPVALATVERNSTNVAAAVKTISGAQPDYVIMISAYGSCAAFVRTMKAAGSSSQYYAVSFVGSRSLAEALGPDSFGIGVSQVVPSPWAAKFAIVREYQAAMEKAGSSTLSFTSLEGYVAAKVLVEGLKRAGRDVNREKLVAALESIHKLDYDGFEVSFSSKEHSASEYVELTLISRDGRIIQ